MKISVFSDLHLESNRFDPSMFLYAGEHSEVIVLAGDIVNAKTYYLLGAIRSLVPKHVHILFTAGNHEYYGCVSLKDHRSMLRKYCEKNNIVFLDRQTFEYDGHLFIGATGWSNLQAYRNEAISNVWDVEDSVGKGIADFSEYVIADWNVEKMKHQSSIDKWYIKKQLRVAQYEKLVPVVVTHFPPLEALNNIKFDISPLSAYFVNNWHDMVGFDGGWIYGHTHGESIAKRIGDTLFMSNMHGYYNECYETFDRYPVTDVSFSNEMGFGWFYEDILKEIDEGIVRRIIEEDGQ